MKDVIISKEMMEQLEEAKKTHYAGRALFWTPEKDEIVRKYYGVIKTDKLAEIIGARNREHVQRRASQLKVRYCRNE